MPLLCSFVSASRAAREKLENHGILDTFVSVIDQECNAERKILALQACVVWLNAEPWKIEARLLTADALDVLVLVFEFSMKNKSNINGESTLNALAQLIGESSRLSRAIIEKKSVMASVLNVIFSEPSVREPSATAVVNSVLKALGHLIEHADKPRDVLRLYDLEKKLKQLAKTQKRSHRRAINRETDANDWILIINHVTYYYSVSSTTFRKVSFFYSLLTRASSFLLFFLPLLSLSSPSSTRSACASKKQKKKFFYRK